MRLPSELRRLLLVNAASYVVFIYIGIFVNLYIWENQYRIADVAWFHLAMFATWAVAFTLAAQLLVYFTIRMLLGISSACGAITFALLVGLDMDHDRLWLTLIAVPTAVSWVFFRLRKICVCRNSVEAKISEDFFPLPTRSSKFSTCPFRSCRRL